MATYSSKFEGYKFIIKPKRMKHENGRIITIPGKAAKFVKGRFKTEDEEIIRVLDHYAQNHPDELSRIDRSLETIQHISEILKQKRMEHAVEREAILVNKEQEVKSEPVEESEPVYKPEPMESMNEFL